MFRYSRNVGQVCTSSGRKRAFFCPKNNDFDFSSFLLCPVHKKNKVFCVMPMTQPVQKAHCNFIRWQKAPNILSTLAERNFSSHSHACDKCFSPLPPFAGEIKTCVQGVFIGNFILYTFYLKNFSI